MSRRRLLELGVAVPAAFVVAGRDATAAAARSSGTHQLSLRATPTCHDGDEPTLEQTEGPFFEPRSPRRRSLLEPGLPGTRLLVTGSVVTTSCRPVRGALLDFWQADSAGRYDNRGYRLRGHQFADAGGRYRLETVVPGLYPGRTRHVHVKVQARGGPVLTTQLYFPGEPRNATDGIFDRELLLQLQRSRALWSARFDFVLDLG